MNPTEKVLFGTVRDHPTLREARAWQFKPLVDIERRQAEAFLDRTLAMKEAVIVEPLTGHCEVRERPQGWRSFWRWQATIRAKGNV